MTQERFIAIVKVGKPEFGVPTKNLCGNCGAVLASVPATCDYCGVFNVLHAVGSIWTCPKCGYRHYAIRATYDKTQVMIKCPECQKDIVYRRAE